MEVLLGALAEAIIALLLDDLTQRPRLAVLRDQWRGAAPEKVALQHALAQSYRALAEQHPHLTAAFFDEHFLHQPAVVAELARLLTPDQTPSAATLLHLWQAQFSMPPSADISPALDFFLDTLARAVKSQPALKPFTDSRALEQLFAIAEHGAAQVDQQQITNEQLGEIRKLLAEAVALLKLKQPGAATDKPRSIFGKHPLFDERFFERFFGREKELAALHSLLQQSSVVITGMGGLGKTQLAAHYAHDYKPNYPDGIFWITAADLGTIGEQLADFSISLGLQVADPQRGGDLIDQKIQAFTDYLAIHPRTLLIFDNVAEPDHLRTHPIRPQVTALTLGGKVIVNTRRRNLPSDKFTKLALKRLRPKPARQILTNVRADLAADPDLNRLCKQFGYLPLMLNLAAAALQLRGGTIIEYLQTLAAIGENELHNIPEMQPGDYKKTLTTVLYEHWRSLNNENARLLFRIAGQLPKTTIIPAARLGLLAGLYDENRYRRPLSDALEHLFNASVLEVVESNNDVRLGKRIVMLSLHPLVHDFAAALLPDERTSLRSACAQRLADAYCNDQTGVQRLGSEYNVRGISELLVDLTTALGLAESSVTRDQSLISSLKSLLQLLRLEASKLHGSPESWQSERLWQQLLLRTTLTATSELTQQLVNTLQGKLHWLPRWGHQQPLLVLEQTLIGHKASVNAVVKLDEQRIVSASDDGTLRVWNLQTGVVEQTLIGHESLVFAVVKLDKQRVVSASHDRTLKVWNLQTGAVEQTLTGHEARVNAVAKLDEQHIVSASDDRTLKVWNLQTSAVEQTLTGHEASVNAVVKLDEQRIVSASADRTLKTWNLQTSAVEQTLIGHEALLRAVALLANQHIIAPADDQTLKVWNLQTGTVAQRLTGHEGSVRALAVLEDQRIVAASNDRTLTVWNLQTGAVEQTFTGRAAWVLAMAALDGQRIVTASEDRTIRVWNLQTGVVERTLTGDADFVKAIAVLNGQHIVSTSYDHLLKVWNLQTGAIESSRYAAWVNAVAVLDEQHIVATSGERLLEVWNLQMGVEQTLTGHTASVRAVAVLDRQHIVSASEDRTLKAWHLETKREIASIGLDGSLICVAVSRQGTRTLVVVGDAAGALYCLELMGLGDWT